MLDVGGLVKGVMSYVTKLELVASVLSRWVRCIFLRLHRGNGIKINIFKGLIDSFTLLIFVGICWSLIFVDLFGTGLERHNHQRHHHHHHYHYHEAWCSSFLGGFASSRQQHDHGSFPVLYEVGADYCHVPPVPYVEEGFCYNLKPCEATICRICLKHSDHRFILFMLVLFFHRRSSSSAVLDNVPIWSKRFHLIEQIAATPGSPEGWVKLPSDCGLQATPGLKSTVLELPEAIWTRQTLQCFFKAGHCIGASWCCTDSFKELFLNSPVHQRRESFHESNVCKSNHARLVALPCVQVDKLSSAENHGRMDADTDLAWFSNVDHLWSVHLDIFHD